MKNIIVLLSLVISFQSFAGDLNLICEDAPGGENVMLVGLENNKGTLKFNGTNIFDQEMKYEVKAEVLKSSLHSVKFTITQNYAKNPYNYKPTSTVTYAQELDGIVMVTPKIYCVIRD